MYSSTYWSASIEPNCCSCKHERVFADAALGRESHPGHSAEADTVQSRHSYTVPRLTHAETAQKTFLEEIPLCPGLLGRAGNAEHQSHCPVNLTKAVVQPPALWHAGLPAGWQVGKAGPVLATRSPTFAALILRATMKAVAFAGAGERQPLAATSPSQQNAAGLR